jgi:hypothetical protein
LGKSKEVITTPPLEKIEINNNCPELGTLINYSVNPD